MFGMCFSKTDSERKHNLNKGKLEWVTLADIKRSAVFNPRAEHGWSCHLEVKQQPMMLLLPPTHTVTSPKAFILKRVCDRQEKIKCSALVIKKNQPSNAGLFPSPSSSSA